MTTGDPPTPATATRSRKNTRERLLDAAFEVFSEVGVSAASVEMIAERAGFTRGAFYSNFDSKVELFFAIADANYAKASETLERNVDAIFAAALPSGHPITAEVVERIVVDVLRLLSVTENKWTRFEAEFETLALRDPAIAMRFADHNRSVIEGLSRLLSSSLGRIGVRFRLPAQQATRLLVAAYTAAVTAHALTYTDASISTSELEDVTALAYLLTERVLG